MIHWTDLVHKEDVIHVLFGILFSFFMLFIIGMTFDE